MNFQPEILVIFSWVLFAISVVVLVSTIFYVVKIARIKAKVKCLNYPIIGVVVAFMLTTFILVICSLAINNIDKKATLLITAFVVAFLSFIVMLIMFNKLSLVITNDEIYIFSDKISIDKIEAVIVDKDRKRLFIAFKNARKQLKSTSFIIGSKYEKIIVENASLLNKEIEELNFEKWKKELQRIDKI